MEKLVIAGSGPAGLTAAIYAARADLKPIVVEGSVPGGQLIVSHEIENYPGFPQPVSGLELMDLFKKQAERFGAGFVTGDVTAIKPCEGGYAVRRGEEELETRALIIATGAEARRLPIPSEPKFYGRGVSGCATCDGAFKLQVLRELDEGRFANSFAAARTYGIRGPGTIKYWARKYGKKHLLGKVIRVETPKEINETQVLRKRVRDLEKALVDAHLKERFDTAYLKIACSRVGIEDVEGFKKKHAMKL